MRILVTGGAGYIGSHTCKALAHQTRDGQSQVINLGAGEGFSIGQLIAVIEEIMGQMVPRRIVSRRQGDPSILVSDATKAKNLLDWQTNNSTLKNIVQSSYAWFSRIINHQ